MIICEGSPFELVLLQEVYELGEVYLEVDLPVEALSLDEIGELLYCLEALLLG